tara:strand:- start:2365 stop:2550 length:186 start_codon:yes stop_codon:yes gene_type:complete
MLTLTRKAGQQVLVGDDVIITVNWISGSQVSLAFDAPLDVSIDRPEYLAKKITEQFAGEKI